MIRVLEGFIIGMLVSIIGWETVLNGIFHVIDRIKDLV
jgi:hypothetical protein